jgi:hypothetical protein
MDSKETEDFRKWLIYSCNYERRSSGDLVSRRNKLLSIIRNPAILSMDQIRAHLEEEMIKRKFSRSTLSGMIRAENLYRKFKDT